MVRNEGYIFTRGSTYIRSLYGLRTDGMVWVDGWTRGMGGFLLYTMIVFTGRLCASRSLRMLAFMCACEC